MSYFSKTVVATRGGHFEATEEVKKFSNVGRLKLSFACSIQTVADPGGRGIG